MSKKWYKGAIYSRVPKRGPAKGTEVFYGRVWVPTRKKRIDFWLGPGKPIEVKQRLAAIYADPEKALADRARKRVHAITFGQVLDQFLTHYKSRAGRTTYYREITVAARAFFGETPIPEIMVHDLDRYLERRRAKLTVGRARVDENGETVMVGAGRRKVSDSTLRKELITLGTIFKWAERRGLATRNPVARVEKPRETSDRTIAVLNADQQTKLLDACSPWVRDVVEWALLSGMRRGEILALRWRDVDQGRCVVHVLGTKTGKVRTVPLALSAKLSAILDRQPRHIGSDLVFCERDGAPLDTHELDTVLESAAKAAGVPKERGVLWNRLRHTWATRLAASGRASIFEVAKWMGNSAAVCERHYAAYVPGAHDRIAGALDDAPAEPAPRKGGTDEGLGDSVGERNTGAA